MNRKIAERTILSIITTFFLVCNVFAIPNRTGVFILTPTIGYYQFDRKWHLESQTMPVLNLGYGLNTHVSAELSVANLSSKHSDTKHSVEGSFYLLNGLYHFKISQKAQPYVLAGVGLINVYPHAETEISLQANLNIGCGLEYFFSDKMALRADVRDVYTPLGDKQDILMLFGVSFLFGNQSY